MARRVIMAGPGEVIVITVKDGEDMARIDRCAHVDKFKLPRGWLDRYISNLCGAGWMMLDDVESAAVNPLDLIEGKNFDTGRPVQ